MLLPSALCLVAAPFCLFCPAPPGVLGGALPCACRRLVVAVSACVASLPAGALRCCVLACVGFALLLVCAGGSGFPGPGGRRSLLLAAAVCAAVVSRLRFSSVFRFAWAPFPGVESPSCNHPLLLRRHILLSLSFGVDFSRPSEEDGSPAPLSARDVSRRPPCAPARKVPGLHAAPIAGDRRGG